MHGKLDLSKRGAQNYLLFLMVETLWRASGLTFDE